MISLNKIILNAINENLTLFLQPIYRAKTNAFVMYEVLSRIKLDNEWVSPKDFLQGVDSTEYHYLTHKLLLKIEKIVEVTSDDFRLSININIADLQHDEILQKIIQLKKFIILELTESDFDVLQNFEVLFSLKKIGIPIVLDNFGSKFSLFNYLQDAIYDKQIFDIIKINGSIITRLYDNPLKQKMIKSLIRFMRSSGQEIVGKEIEDIRTAEILKKLNIDYLQGFYFSEPFLADVLIQKFLIERRKKAS